MDRPKSISRRRVLAAGTAGIVGAALPIAGQNPSADPTKVQGPLSTDVGGRSPFERPKRMSLGERRTSSLTPLQDLDGIITPSDLTSNAITPAFRRSIRSSTRCRSTAWSIGRWCSRLTISGAFPASR